MPELKRNASDHVGIQIRLAKLSGQIKTVLPLKQNGRGTKSLKNLQGFEILPDHQVVDIVNQVPLALTVTNNHDRHDLTIDQIIVEITNYKKFLPDLFKVVSMDTKGARQAYFPIELNMDPDKKSHFLFKSLHPHLSKIVIQPGQQETFFIRLTGKDVGRYDFVFRTYVDFNGIKSEKQTHGKFRLIQLNEHDDKRLANQKYKNGISMPLTMLTQQLIAPVKTKTRPALQPGKLADEYSVQIGAFSKKANALKSYSQYKNKGYSIFMYSTKKQAKTMFLVRIGRFSTKKQAVHYAQKLKKAEKLDFYVVKVEKSDASPIMMAEAHP